MTLTEYTLTGVPMVSSRSTVNEPRMAMPPMRAGSADDTKLPKMIISKITRTGTEIISARAMFPATSALIATSAGTCPPTCAEMPAWLRGDAAIVRSNAPLTLLVGGLAGLVVGARQLQRRVRRVPVGADQAGRR